MGAALLSMPSGAGNAVKSGSNAELYDVRKTSAVRCTRARSSRASAASGFCWTDCGKQLHRFPVPLESNESCAPSAFSVLDKPQRLARWITGG